MLIHYGSGALAAAAATATVLMVKDSPPVATFILAVVISAALGGVRAAVIATALSFAALATLALTDFPFSAQPSNLLRVFYFALIGGFIVWIIAAEGRAVAAMRRNASQLRLVIDTIPTMAWSLLPDGRIEFLNQRWLDYTGLSQAEAIARPDLTIHPDDRPRIMENWREIIGKGVGYDDEMRLRRADGAYRWFLVRTVPLHDEAGRVVRWYGTSTDIEDRKQAAERLQHLSRRLLEVQEEERRRLSRELHDEFGQILVSINLHLHAARTLAGDAAQPNLEKSIALVERASEQARKLVLELRPAILEGGVDATLRWLAAEHERRTGTPTTVDCRAENVPAEAATACFRVVQEALTNIARHANAGRVSIGLEQGADRVSVEVRDDGAGFEVAPVLASAAGQGHVGLLGMRERVQILGGELDIDSAPGRGTRIRVSIPVAAPLP